MNFYGRMGKSNTPAAFLRPFVWMRADFCPLDRPGVSMQAFLAMRLLGENSRETGETKTLLMLLTI
ncbi:hypothetical protein ABEO47_08925 [Heyndrickxia faecalis]|uniref:hypothetical protein n=1 Tax=Heyndrickxia faecalis TaxID=2824910 RepID=UPI003D1E07DB